MSEPPMNMTVSVPATYGTVTFPVELDANIMRNGSADQVLEEMKRATFAHMEAHMPGDYVEQDVIASLQAAM